MPDVRDPHYDEDLLWRDRLVAALPADGVLAARPVLSWNLLGATPLIFRTAHQEMHAYKTLIGHPALDGAQHDVSLGTLLEMVALGIGSTILPESAATSHTGVVFRPIVEANAFVEVKAVWPRGDANPLRHRLLVHLRRHARTGPASPISHREQAMTRAEDPG
jgi:DNA-binding transcriptional LysR family regulator